MEQAQYWLWMKRKRLLKSQLPASMKSMSGSWEEKAFAEDSSGHLGGCIWPPRSYSCSFCKREFRATNIASTTLSSSRVSTLSNQENLSEHAFASPPSSSLVQEQHKGYPYLHNNLSGSDHSLSVRLRSKPEAERNQVYHHLVLVVMRLSVAKGLETNVSVLSLFVKPRPSDRYNILQSGETRPDSSSNEDIDLELRLGETPEVIK
ncbi:hypothetical protein OIU84_019785 [Salix udensis]|uniref:Uncharacterized protein n=1 Tax=Salix udensis TaxID=889485 RepID=A0AAD6PJV3_9ROSI|nr:hypothetical protein OIU84_019785 [Salix udensis]